MPFKAISETDFIGRDRELARLKRLADGKEGITANNLLLEGARGIGKTELLNQLYRILFMDGKNTLPFYYSFQRATLKASSFSRDYFSRFVRQFLAFLKRDPSIAENMSIPLTKLTPMAYSLGLQWLIDLIDDFQDHAKSADPYEQILAAASAPVAAAGTSGISVVVMLDDFQLATRLYEVHPGDATGLVGLFGDALRTARTPHILSGSPEGSLESIFIDDSLRGRAVRLTVGALQEDEAFALFTSFCSPLGITVPDESRELMKFLGGNPLYIRNMARAFGRMQKKIVTARDFWECYSYEISEGETAFYWSSVLGELLRDVDKRSIVLEVLMHEMDSSGDDRDLGELARSLGLPRPAPRGKTRDLGKLARNLDIPETSMRAVWEGLQASGIILGAGTVQPGADNICRDFVKGLYMREVEGKEPGAVRKLIEEKHIDRNESYTFDMTIPMESDTELVAAKAIEQIGKNISLNPEVISQLQLALIEACINAKEHSGSYEKKISLKFNATPERVEMAIESPGKAFAPEPAGRKFTIEEKLKSEHKRGMGLKLMREVMDDIRVETVNGRTRVVLIKNII